MIREASLSPAVVESLVAHGRTHSAHMEQTLLGLPWNIFKADTYFVRDDASRVNYPASNSPAMARLSRPMLLDGADCEDNQEPNPKHCSTRSFELIAARLRRPKMIIQVFPVFVLAGLGMVAAGLLLNVVRRWPVFVEVPEILILVPALLGLKGNLEMTLAARLATHANLGHFEGGGQMWNIVTGNLSIVQCQSIVVGLLAALVAVTMNFFTTGFFHGDHALVLASSAVTAASIASLTLAVMMVALVWSAHRMGLNPDNVASPIAGMLGDFVTLVLLSGISQFYWNNDAWIQVVTLLAYCVILPTVALIAARNDHSACVLREGWTPVIVAMLLSSVGGLILRHSSLAFPKLAPFAPVTNGAGGNLAAIQASRISTDLHSRGRPGTKMEFEKETDARAPCLNMDKHDRAGLSLSLMVVPGALLFATLIIIIASNGTSMPAPKFLIIYIIAVLVQAQVLVAAARTLVVRLWDHGSDPDNGAIPYVTALGDVVGTGMLTMAFWTLQLLGGEPWR